MLFCTISALTECPLSNHCACWELAVVESIWSLFFFFFLKLWPVFTLLKKCQSAQALPISRNLYLAAKQSVGGLLSRRSAALASKRHEQIASSYISAVAWWQPWDLNVLFLVWFVFFSCWFHPLESRRLGTARGVEGAPAALYRYTSPRFQAQTHQKWPWQAAISWDWLSQYKRIWAFYGVFSQPKVRAVRRLCAISSPTKADLALPDVAFNLAS